MRFSALLVLALVVAMAPFDVLGQDGVVVVEIFPASPAIESGILVGDVIDGWRDSGKSELGDSAAWRPVASPFDLSQLAISLSKSSKTQLRVRRDGESQAINVHGGYLGLATAPNRQSDAVSSYERLEGMSDEEKLVELTRLADYYENDVNAKTWYLSQLFIAAFRSNQLEAGRGALERSLDDAAAVPRYQSWLRLRAGEALFSGGKYAEAEKMLEEATQAATGVVNNESLHVLAGHLRARVANYSGRFADGRRFAETALRRQRAVAKDSLAAAEALHSLGNTAFWTSDYDLAEQRHREALALRVSIAEGSIDHGRSIGALGNIAWRRGDLDRAESLFLQAYDLHQKALPDSLLAAGDLTMLGHVAYDRRKFALAEGYYSRSLTITEAKYPGEETVANTLMGMGNAARQRFDLPAARSFHTAARQIYENLNARQRVALVLLNLGNVEASDGHLEKAEQLYEESLALRKELQSTDYSLAFVWFNMARVEYRRGNYETARELQLKALKPFSEQSPDSLRVQMVLFALGETALADGDIVSARESFADALKIASALAPGTMYQAESLHRLGKVALQEGEQTVARDYYVRALAAFEAQRRLVGGSGEAQRKFSGKFAYLYKDLAQLLIELDEPVAAFDIIERYRARVLVALVLGRGQDVERPGPLKLRQKMASTRQSYDDALAELMWSSGKDAKAVAEIKQRLEKARSNLEVVESRYRAFFPRRAMFEYPDPLPLDKAKDRLPDGAVVLSYAIIDDTVNLFVTSSGDEELCHLIPLGVSADQLQKDVAAYMKLLQIESPNDALRDALWRRSSQLYAQLIQPAEHLIGDARRLVILADDTLHGLAFAALATNTPGSDNPKYLIERYAIQLAPSVHWLVATATDKDRGNERSVAVFADPIPSSREGRGVDASAAISNPGLPRLPGSRREAHAIAEAFDATILYLGEEATEASAKALSGSDNSILHFATHAIVNSERPLESFLVLRGSGDDEDPDNGLLQAREVIEQMELQSDLVFLSACDTALGRLSAGEGVTGLTSSFLYAGADNIVSTFWPVGDTAASQFVERYYVELRDGHTPAAALRLAQLAMIDEHRSHQSTSFAWLRRFLNPNQTSRPGEPSQWAAFQLYGSF